MCVCGMDGWTFVCVRGTRRDRQIRLKQFKLAAQP